jgi:DNA-binding transcriptional LysR family regulator
MDGIDLNDVATFVRVADGGGFTAAANALGVPKSTVSRSLARLERVLGVRLVHRTTRALALTEAGRAYYDRVRGAVLGVAEATADVVDLGTEPRGSIRVTTPVDVGQVLLAEVVAGFVQRYPQVHFEVTLTSRIVDLVAEGFDLALRASELRDSSLVARRIGNTGMGLFASPAYLKRRGTPKAVADLASHEFIRFRSSRGPLVLEGGGEGAHHFARRHRGGRPALRAPPRGAGRGRGPLAALLCRLLHEIGARRHHPRAARLDPARPLAVSGRPQRPPRAAAREAVPRVLAVRSEAYGVRPHLGRVNHTTRPPEGRPEW